MGHSESKRVPFSLKIILRLTHDTVACSCCYIIGCKSCRSRRGISKTDRCFRNSYRFRRRNKWYQEKLKFHDFCFY